MSVVERVAIVTGASRGIGRCCVNSKMLMMAQAIGVDF